MIDLHPQILEQNGQKAFAVLPYDEFLRVAEMLDDYEDLRLLREAKRLEKDADILTLAELKRELKLN